MFPINQFPYTNFHELNLDWLLATVKELSKRLEVAGVLPAPVEGQNGWLATVVDGEWMASGVIPEKVSALEGAQLINTANFESINRRLEEIYSGIVDLSQAFDDINRMVVV